MEITKENRFDWSAKLAYAVGLLATDGSLSSDNRHIDITSKDREQLENFLKCVNNEYKISSKKSGAGNLSLRIQFSDVTFYKFLLSLGITPHKSKTLGPVKIPQKYIFDFLRGHFDGDGTFYSYKDPRWKNSYMYYLCFVSASEAHIKWIRGVIKAKIDIHGSLTKVKTNACFQLKYAKTESLKLITKLYYNHDVVCLSRKRKKIEEALRVNNKQIARVL